MATASSEASLLANSSPRRTTGRCDLLFTAGSGNCIVNRELLEAPLSAGSTALLRLRWPRPKYLLFAFVSLMFAYVLRHNEYFLVEPNAPVWQHYQPFKWWLLPHGLAGACALLLGPMQFSDRLRQRFTRLHRVLGRIYVAGALIAAPLGAYIQYFEERIDGTRSITLATVVLAFLWMTTTGIAFAFILKGKVQQHRQWMTRS